MDGVILIRLRSRKTIGGICMLYTNVFTNMFNDMFDDVFPMTTRAARPVHAVQQIMNCDVREYDDHYVLSMELAGFHKGDIKAELKDGYLTIKAERSADNDAQDDGGRTIRSERFMGTCQRTFYVGEHVQRDDVKAAFEDGVLKLSIPKKTEQPHVEESHYIAIQ